MRCDFGSVRSWSAASSFRCFGTCRSQECDRFLSLYDLTFELRDQLSDGHVRGGKFQFRLTHCLIALFLCFLFLLTAPFGALSLGTTIMNVVRLADRRRRLADTTRD